jgi:hypothetical protein
MKKNTTLEIPDTVKFSDLKLARDNDGMVSFDWAPIDIICEASNIDPSLFKKMPEENVSALINEWYKSHLSNGGTKDLVQEDLIAETRFEDLLGGGVSHKPSTDAPPKNLGNQNAKKDVVKQSQIQIRCTQEEKALIVRNLNRNEKLSEFMLKLALNEAKRRSC